MIEQLIESKITAAVNALALDGLTVFGAWSPAAVGALKNAEGESLKGVLDVAVPVRAFEKETTMQLAFACTATLSWRMDEDVTGAGFLAAASAITDLLQSWHGGENMEAASAALSVTGFAPSFFRFDGGTAPAFLAETGIWQTTFSFTVRGYQAPAEPTTTE